MKEKRIKRIETDKRRRYEREKDKGPVGEAGS